MIQLPINRTSKLPLDSESGVGAFTSLWQVPNLANLDSTIQKQAAKSNKNASTVQAHARLMLGMAGELFASSYDG